MISRILFYFHHCCYYRELSQYSDYLYKFIFLSPSRWLVLFQWMLHWNIGHRIPFSLNGLLKYLLWNLNSVNNCTNYIKTNNIFSLNISVMNLHSQVVILINNSFALLGLTQSINQSMLYCSVEQNVTEYIAKNKTQ